MDLNDISINSLICNAGLWGNLDYVGCGDWTASCGTFTMTIGTYNRDIEIEDSETCTRVVFRHICPQPFDALLDALRIDEEEAA